MDFSKCSLSWVAAFVLLISCGLEPPQLKEKEVSRVDESPAEVEEPEESVRPESFPRVLTDKQGRTIDATIIGHEPGYVTIIRTLDNQRFELAVSNLSEEDQTYVKTLPMFDPPAESAEPESKKEHTIAAFHQRRIDDLEKEIERLKGQLASYERKSMKWRSITSEIERLEKEKQELLTDLHD